MLLRCRRMMEEMQVTTLLPHFCRLVQPSSLHKHSIHKGPRKGKPSRQVWHALALENNVMLMKYHKRQVFVQNRNMIHRSVVFPCQVALYHNTVWAFPKLTSQDVAKFHTVILSLRRQHRIPFIGSESYRGTHHKRPTQQDSCHLLQTSILKWTFY